MSDVVAPVSISNILVLPIPTDSYSFTQKCMAWAQNVQQSAEGLPDILSGTPQIFFMITDIPKSWYTSFSDMPSLVYAKTWQVSPHAFLHDQYEAYPLCIANQHGKTNGVGWSCFIQWQGQYRQKPYLCSPYRRYIFTRTGNYGTTSHFPLWGTGQMTLLHLTYTCSLIFSVHWSQWRNEIRPWTLG